MSNCSRCGAALREDARFCLSCGEPVAPARLSAADFLSGSVQPPSRSPSPAAGPPNERVVASGWEGSFSPPSDPRTAPPGAPQPAAAWPAATAPEAPAPLHEAPPFRADAVATTAAPVAADDLERALARSRSYIGASVLVFFLYALFYFPGLIINRMYLTEAQETERIAGRKLPGTGCLTTLLWLGLIPAVLVALLFIVALGGSLHSLF